MNKQAKKYEGMRKEGDEMSMLRWTDGPLSIFGDLERLQDEVFGRSGLGLPRGREYPPVNAWLSDDNLIIDAELPGVDAKQVQIALEDGTLKLSGSRAAEELKAGETYHRQERPHGKFARTFRLPFNAEGDKVSASYKNGILRITVPRAESDKPRKIAISAA